jgi:rhodanese-related sulfurtransferase
MKKIKLIMLLTCITTFAVTTVHAQEVVTTVQTEQTTQVVNNTPKEFKAAIDAGNCTILDVRTEGEVAKGKIEGSVNIDWFADDFEQKVKELDKTKTLLVYCAAGGRSEEAAAMLAALGFKKVHNLTEGMNGWKAAGMPVSK